MPSEGVGARVGAFGNPCTRSLPPALVRVVSAFERTSLSPWSQKLKRDPPAPGTQLLKRGDNNLEGDRKGRARKKKGKGKEGDEKKGRRRFLKKIKAAIHHPTQT